MSTGVVGPIFTQKLLKALWENGIHTVGITRKSWKVPSKIRRQFNKYSPVSGLITLYF